MLDPRDLRQVVATFRVAEDQVRRDHLIGHGLAALARMDIAGLTFIGGTALSWTHLPDGRLSEDIDLMTRDRRAAAEPVDRELPRQRDSSLLTVQSCGSSSWMSTARAGMRCRPSEEVSYVDIATYQRQSSQCRHWRHSRR